jgi:peptidoglycan lytic transglycosylase
MQSLIFSRRRSAYAVAALVCGALALPASGRASSGGAGVGPGASGLAPAGGGGGTGAQSSPAVQSGNVTVSATGNGVTLQTNASAMLRRGLGFSGTAAQDLAGDTVEIERSGHQTNWTWAPTASATIGSDGSFAARWDTNHIGRFAIRAVIVSPGAAQTATVTPPLTITVYRPSLATQYGPGFYGHRTACGTKLTRSTIGVANRTLKCGTEVAVYYSGRILMVPVIDRGPYANGADWDLTMATGRALGISGTAQIGAVSLPQR